MRRVDPPASLGGVSLAPGPALAHADVNGDCFPDLLAVGEGGRVYIVLSVGGRLLDDVGVRVSEGEAEAEAEEERERERERE